MNKYKEMSSFTSGFKGSEMKRCKCCNQLFGLIDGEYEIKCSKCDTINRSPAYQYKYQLENDCLYCIAYRNIDKEKCPICDNVL